MKKYPLITLLLITLVLAGCVNNTPTNQNTNETLNTNQDTTTTTNEVILTPTTTQESNNTPTTTETIDTSDWLTYRNEEYGFEFKYPDEIAGKEFGIRELTTLYGDYAKFGIGIAPHDSAYQDYMMTVVIFDKGKINDPDFLPSGLRSNYYDYEKIFNISGTEIKGYEFIVNSENYEDRSKFVSQFILITGKNYDYYINSGFFLSTKKCIDKVICYRVTDAIILTFNIN
jgi:hypothetical protein